MLDTDAVDPRPARSMPKWKRVLKKILMTAAILAVPLGLFTWHTFFRSVDQPDWITRDPEANFLYGSIGAENQGGIPYWIVVVLPRIFGDDYLPGPGGYASLGLPWEEGKELPAGFSKKRIGFDRVGFNCALCHATQYRVDAASKPAIIGAGSNHTADIQGLLEFFGKSARDPRFNAETILTEIDLAYRLSWIDRQIYKYLLIPITRKRLIQQADDFAWADHRPRWGPGRDAPMNLTKFNFLRLPHDTSVDNTDFPAIWHLDARVQPGRTWPEQDYSTVADFSTLKIDPSSVMLMNLAGDTTSFRSVLIDSALGLQAENTPFFHQRMRDLEQWLRKVRPPAYPFELSAASQAQAVRGEQIFERECASCHASGRTNRLGTVIPTAEIGTDPERTNAWTLEAANGANRIVAGFGIQRTPMAKPPVPGYVAPQLDGIWLRGPFLHNGSVPTVRALLEPPSCRPTVFHRGYDVLDPDHIGFVSRRCGDPPEPPHAGCPATPVQSGCIPVESIAGPRGWRYDTRERGNSNAGHAYGSSLDAADKDALLQFLKRQ